MFKRIFLFMLVNILVVITISIVTSLLGVNHYLTARGINYSALMGFCLVWGFGGAFISLAISRWIAKFSMGIKPIDPSNCSSEERDLYNLVAQLSQKAGLPAVPEVGIFESEEMNAFATGPSKKRSLVAVSRGLLEKMDKGEVQGVLAHEIAHIANGDMVTMTLLQGVVNAFVMFFARIVAFSLTQFVKDDIRPLVNMLTIIVLEILFSFLGMFVIAWFSRLREYRADEGGARYGGRSNMIGALESLKRAYHVDQEESNNKAAPASLAAFQISNKRGWISYLSTHPALEDRIAALKANKTFL